VAPSAAVGAMLTAQTSAQKSFLKTLTAKTFETLAKPAGVEGISAMPTGIEAAAADGSVKINGADFGTETPAAIDAIIAKPVFVATICAAISDAINPSLMKIDRVTRRLAERDGRQLADQALKMRVKSTEEIKSFLETMGQVCAAGKAANNIPSDKCPTDMKFNDFGVCAGAACNSTVDNVPGICCKSSKESCATIVAGDSFCGTGRTLKVESSCAAACGAGDLETCCNAAVTPTSSSNSVVVSAAVAFFLALWQ